MGSEPREDLSDDPGTLSLLASAISGRALRVAPGEPGEPAWTDGSAIFVAGDAPTRRQAEAVAVQASLLAAGSLDPEVVRDLVRRPALARRYLAIEGHRALAAMVDWLPPSLRPLVDAEVAARADSPAASLAAARSRKAIAAPPERFGAIRAKKLLRAIDRAERPARTETKVPRAPSEPLDPSASHPAEQGADGAFDLLSSPGDRGGALGRLFARMLSAVRRLRNGGAPDADAPTQRSLARAFGGVHSAISIGGADALEADVFERRGARYPEWDVHRRCYRPDWCTVIELDPAPDARAAPAGVADPDLHRPLARLGMGLDRYRRQAFGDEIDIDAAIEARVEVMAGSAPDEAFYVDSLRRRRDLAVLVLLDISGSSAEPAANSATGRTVHEQQREAAAALTTALHAIGDRVALYAFRSQGPSSVLLVPVKRFDETFSALVVRRLHSLAPGMFSRLGAAIRHGTTVLKESGGTSRRLLVVLSDGLAYDHGYEPEYGAADARQALGEARRQGVGCLCLSIGASTEPHALRQVFGTAAHATIPDPGQLSSVIGPLFRSAVRSAEISRQVAA